jgi:serine O-acetyltransferase
VLAEVPAGATVVGIPARPVGGPRPLEAKAADSFLPYGTPCDEIPDPVARAFNGLLDEVQSLRVRLAEVEQQLDSTGAPVLPFADGAAASQARRKG